MKRFFIILITIFFIPYKFSLAEDDQKAALNYLNTLENFSASFLQNDGSNLSEGKIFIGNKRVRAEYFSPEKILIILSEDKAMYYNYELEEDEFLIQRIQMLGFYDILKPNFLENSQISIINNELILEKIGVDNEGKNFTLRVLFEKSPLVLRAVEIIIEDNFLRLSIYNHSYSQDFDMSLFKLISPKLLN